MAKSSFWLRGAKGKLGGATIYTANGESVMRVVTGKIKNPKTQAQVIQRVIAKCSASQYSALKAICDHSFEGVKPGADSMAHFTSLNNRRFRELAAQANMTGAGLGSVFNFLPLGRKKFVPTEVIISEGSLPRVYSTSETIYARITASIAENTYEGVINSLGLQRGDQLTFITVSKDAADAYVLSYARVILDPRESDGTAAPLSTTFVENGKIVKPSFRNEGNYDVLAIDNGNFDFALNGDDIAACAVIVSREQNGQWQRSTCVMSVKDEVLGDDAMSLGEAVEVSMQGTPIYTESARILNNAGVGGPQASSGNE